MELAYQIPRSSLIWVLSSVVLAMAPQGFRLPGWVSLIAAICILWRVLIFLGKLDYPGKSMRLFVVVFIVLLSLTQLQSLNVNLEVATILLALGFVFKLIEMRNKRDIYVVLCLCFVMALVSFLYSESVMTTVYFTVVIMVIIATMISLNRSNTVYNTTSTIRLAVRIMAQSIPIMVVLFLVFPRIAPLWGVPLQSNIGKTGVSDEMSPGDISSLGRSADLAFRVTFENSPPPLHENLYWRGLVLDYFDGTTWTRQRASRLRAAAGQANFDANYENRINTSGNPIEYNIIMEPTQQPWLFGLHLAEPVSSDVVRGENFELFANGIVTHRVSYDLRAYRNYQTDLLLLDSVRSNALRLPYQGNPRSRELAVSLRAGVETDRDYAYTVLSLFQQEEYFYTLSPPLLGINRIDEFLFDIREGFCEHFAGSFTFMMRAAGVPARVVVGYQGAEYNRFEDYMMVYQYNAHAWTEVWLEGEGWVRFDPTAIVSPERIKLGVEAALRDDPRFMDDSFRSFARFRNSNWLNTLRLRLDAIEYEWNRRVVGYGQETQFELFENLFGEVTSRKVITLMVVTTSLALLFVGLTVIRLRSDNPGSKIEILYRDCCRDLGRIGLARQQGEGPMDYYQRVIQQEPSLGPDLAKITDMYINLNYKPLAEGPREYLRIFKKELRLFRLKLTPLMKRTLSHPGLS